jgi:hypothetical protein
VSTLEERVQQLEAEVERFRDDGASAGAIVLVSLLLLGFIIGVIYFTAKGNGAEGWVASGAVGGWVAAFATIAYVIFTVRLWRAAVEQVRSQRRTSEAAMMLSLITDYDQRREDIQVIRQFCDQHTYKAPEMFQWLKSDSGSQVAKVVDPARFRISRSFVRIRKLADAGYLDRRLIVAALDEPAIRLFLDKVNPLDATISPPTSREMDRDRVFFTELLHEYEQNEKDSSATQER